MTALAYVIGVLVLVLGLAVSIALHELGHLAPAKKFGVRVGQYMIGFGPTLFSRRRGETEYGVKVLPLGGYISMAGMYPPSPKQRQRDGKAGGGFFATMVQDARDANDETLGENGESGVFYKLPVYKRVIIMLGGPVMNFLLAIVIFTILLSGIGVQTAMPTVASVSECIQSSASQTECSASDPVAPAQAAGILPGDILTSIDGEPIDSFEEISSIVRAAPGEQLSVVVDRDGATQTLTLTPAVAEVAVYDEQGLAVTDDSGAAVTEQVGQIGIRPEFEYVRQPLWAGTQTSVETVGRVFTIIWQLPGKVIDTGATLFTGEERDPNGPLSLVGAGALAGEAAAAEAPIVNRVSAILSLVASLNVMLFVFNLVPLLPLDGGHVVVALWDGIKRAFAKLTGRAAPKPVDATKLVPITFVFVLALGAMFVVLVLADIFNPISLF